MSPGYMDIPSTKPGKLAKVTALLRAPTYDCSSIAYFKMADAKVKLCFPDSYQLGLDVLVLVRGQLQVSDSVWKSKCMAISYSYICCVTYTLSICSA
jgi:hypothetical protein